MRAHPVVWFFALGSIAADLAALAFGIAGSEMLSARGIAFVVGLVFVALAFAAALASVSGKALALTIHSGLRHRTAGERLQLRRATR